MTAMATVTDITTTERATTSAPGPDRAGGAFMCRVRHCGPEPPRRRGTAERGGSARICCRARLMMSPSVDTSWSERGSNSSWRTTGKHSGDPVPPLRGDLDQGGALVSWIAVATDEAGSLQQRSLVGQPAAAVHDTVGELGHAQCAPGVDELGEDLELDIAELTLGLQLLLHCVLQEADRFGQREVGAHLSRFEGGRHDSRVVLRSRSSETVVTVRPGNASTSKQVTPFVDASN